VAKRAVLLVIDGFGVGALPDAHLYGDEGANTALHICEGVSRVNWQWLKRLGLGNCAELLGHRLPGCEAVSEPMAGFAVMRETSPGKDTTTGHFELSGLVLDKPFQTFPPEYPSFPVALTNSFEEVTGYKLIGNKSASGTVIIEELGERHLNGEGLIVYTSADSVVQIAAHEQIVPLDELYSICQKTRKICDQYNVGRVIARPFTGEPGNFVRTSGRRDFSMLPADETILDRLQSKSVETVAVGKIGDIFSEQGITTSFHDKGNEACLKRLLQVLKKESLQEQFIFVNLVDTDMYFGHRRDIQGYHDAVEKIDRIIPQLMENLSDNDILLITADHGCDPSYKGSDHTREYVPLLMFQKGVTGQDLGIRNSFADVAQSLAYFFDVAPMQQGVSFI